MATLSFGVTGPTMQFAVDMTIADADAPRILGYLASTEYGIASTVGEDGVAVTRPATLEETAKAFASGILRGLLDQTVRFERDQAAAAAANAIQNIDVIA